MQVHRYREVEVFHQNQFSSVALCEDICDKNKLYIVKTIKCSQVMFANELYALSLLKDSQYVPKLINSFQCTDCVWKIVLDYVPSKTLKAYGKLTPKQTRQLFNAYQSVLNALYKGGLILLDVKPDNILVNENGMCFIIDFGGCVYERSINHTSTLVYTEGYLPPEWEAGMVFTPRLFRRIAVWSIGLTLYYALYGDLMIERSMKKTCLGQRQYTRRESTPDGSNDIVTLIKKLLNVYTHRLSYRKLLAYKLN